MNQSEPFHPQKLMAYLGHEESCADLSEDASMPPVLDKYQWSVQKWANDVYEYGGPLTIARVYVALGWIVLGRSQAEDEVLDLAKKCITALEEWILDPHEKTKAVTDRYSLDRV